MSEAYIELLESELLAWRIWRDKLLESWANDERATMTALLEMGPDKP